MPNYIDILNNHITSEAGDGVKAEKRNLLSTDETSAAGPGFDSGNIIDFYELDGQAEGSKVKKILSDDFKYLKNQNLYKDEIFPANDSSMGTKEFCARNGPFTWLRPKDILERTDTDCEPKFFVDGPSRFDIAQGELGDCWFLAAAAALAMNKDLLYQVVPKNQSFRKGRYDGTFHFRFWQFGEWKDVVVDDYLPTCADKNGKPYLFSLSSTVDDVNNEFWPALLQKAYAKLYGSYQAMDGGYFSEAMDDFTGGVSETYAADSNRKVDLFKVLLEAWNKKSLIGCSFKSEIFLDDEGNDDDNETEDEENGVDYEGNEDGDDSSSDASDKSSGLLTEHAYSVTYVGYVKKGIENPEKISILRIRNPWGNDAEWQGAWSDKSGMWDSVSKKEKDRLGWERREDGEFWMSFEDFNRYYEDVEICHFNLNDFSDSTDKKQWEISEFQGAWVVGATAGGCICDPEMFSRNPQYRMTLEEETTVFVVVVQKNRRTKDLKGSNYFKIGLSIYPLEGEPLKPLDSDFFKDATKIETDSYMSKESASLSFQYDGKRTVSYRLKLKPGVYCIVPNALKDHEEGEFLLRVFSDNKSTVEEYDQELESPRAEYFNKKFDKEKKLRDIVTMVYDKKPPLPRNKSLKKLFDQTMYNDESYDGVGFTFKNCESIVAMLLRKRSNKNDQTKNRAYARRTMILAKAFNDYAGKKDGFIEALDLRYALNEADYFLDNRTLCDLVRRYRTPEHKGRCYINFDDFFACANEVEKKYIDESSELE